MNISNYIQGDSFSVHNFRRQHPFYSKSMIFLNHRSHVFPNPGGGGGGVGEDKKLSYPAGQGVDSTGKTE